MAEKTYVVWIGRRPGIYESWDKCRIEVEGYKSAMFKSYKTEEEARAAYAAGPPGASVSSPPDGPQDLKSRAERGKEENGAGAPACNSRTERGTEYPREVRDILDRMCGPGHDRPPEEGRR
jgi:hypothetical protein